MHRAALFGQIACVKKLHAFKADVNIQDADGNTPLHLASKVSLDTRDLLYLMS